MNRYSFDAVIFDLDGVITKTALVHATAWKNMFDGFLKEWEKKHGKIFIEFTHYNDYLPYVDGKPRYKGVESFLKSRGIDLPYGDPSDSPNAETICGLGNRKNDAFNEILQRDGVEVYESTVALLDELKEKGIKLGVASSSKNCKQVLERANLLHYFETRVDGEVSAELGLHGKPEPDIFIKACDNLKVEYFRAVIVEDAVSGVQAGQKGNFGFVLGVARENNETELKANGADVVVTDLEEINGVDGIEKWFDLGLNDELWSISFHKFNCKDERSREALLTVGNGYFGTRGSLEESQSSDCTYPATYMAGVYNRIKSPVGDREVENEDFVNTINWTTLSFKVSEDDWFDPNQHEVVELSRSLNFRNGVLIKRMIVCDNDGRETLIESRRIASMANQHHAAIDYSLTPLNYSGYIRVKSALSIPKKNDGVERYRELNQNHMKPIEQGAKNNISFIHGKTTQSAIEIAAAARIEVFYQDKPLATNYRVKNEKGWVNTYIKAMVKEGETLRIEKLVSLCNSRSNNTPKPLEFVKEDIKHLKSFGIMHAASIRAWEKIWDQVDIHITGDRIAQKLIRMHIYHSLSTTSPHNEDIDFGIPARGLHGEAYRGHIFWDELYILPFYCLHFPEVAKSVLMYRYRRLSKAREYAKEHGYEGAMFPWQSGSDGREETQVVHLNPVSGEWGDDYSSLQRHISIAVAYNVWNYYNITGDTDFISTNGAEMFLDICKFWASKATLNQQTGKIDIDGVMGPDEFHEKNPESNKGGLKNNAYTNIMVAWLFEKANELIRALDKTQLEKVLSKIGLSNNDIKGWSNMAQKMSVSINQEGIIEQFEGYFNLKELDWDEYRKKYDDIHRMDRILKAEGKSPDDYKVSKQPDTLMTFFNIDPREVQNLLVNMGYKLPKDFLQKNFDYYIQRCSHGSTLSRVVHSYVASQIGRKDLAWELYLEALKSDFSDIQGGTTAEGIHMGVMAGTVIMTLTSYAGLNFHSDTLSINPSLPKHWKSLRFSCTFKGVGYKFNISKNAVTIEAGKDKTTLVVKGKSYSLNANDEISIKIE
ncbi:MAG: beta-phosphoglucomutase family hydrolase [Bacteroidales bacterium]|nr:beta-phosphoglucomutase family hydrolase [Bacteroidales bacterium]